MYEFENFNGNPGSLCMCCEFKSKVLRPLVDWENGIGVRPCNGCRRRRRSRTEQHNDDVQQGCKFIDRKKSNNNRARVTQRLVRLTYEICIESVR